MVEALTSNSLLFSQTLTRKQIMSYSIPLKQN